MSVIIIVIVNKQYYTLLIKPFCYVIQKLLSSLPKVPFVFTGLKNSVENAKLMLEYHMEHLKVVFITPY